MATLDRLLGALTRVYDTSAGPILGLRLSYLNGAMRWSIANDTLTTTVTGGMGVALSVPLGGYTLSTLASYLASQPGYVVLYLDPANSGTSALALVPGAGDIATSNGDHIAVATNPTWTLLSSIAAELSLAQQAIAAMPAEMATTTADGGWLDVLGGYYAVPRQLQEQDTQYAARIPAEVILPRQNNLAIVAALQTATGQRATCTDSPAFGKPEPAYDDTIAFSGAPHFFNATAERIYNLFDVSIGYDILGSYTPAGFLAAVRQQIERLRAAGTHLRTLSLTSSVMSDSTSEIGDSLTEVIRIGSLSGIGSSADNGVSVIFPPYLSTAGARSADSAVGVLAGGILLAGTGASVDQVALPILVGTGASADSGVATGAGSILIRGTGGDADSALGTLTTRVAPAGTGASADTGVASLGQLVGLSGTGTSTDMPGRGGPAFSTGFSSGFGGSALPSLSTPVQLAGTGTSADSAGNGVDPFSAAFSGVFGGGLPRLS